MPSPATDRLAAAARQAEQLSPSASSSATATSGGTLYCTLLYFSPQGELLGLHRKLKPTAAERLIWGEGDGSTLTVVDSPYGRIGGLICWENYMPLARMAMYAKGVSLYLAPTANRARYLAGHPASTSPARGAASSWAATSSSRRPCTRPTCPGSKSWRASRKSSAAAAAPSSPRWARSSPVPLDAEGILTAELDLGEIARSRFDFDVTGHYARPDVFRFSVNDSP